MHYDDDPRIASCDDREGVVQTNYNVIEKLRKTGKGWRTLVKCYKESCRGGTRGMSGDAADKRAHAIRVVSKP